LALSFAPIEGQDSAQNRAGGQLGFQARLTLVAASAVALSILVAAVVVYFVARAEVLGQIDTGLANRAATASARGSINVGPTVPDPYLLQIVRLDGSVLVSSQAVSPAVPPTPVLPVSGADRLVAEGAAPGFYRTETVNHVPFRIYTSPVFLTRPPPQRAALEIGVPLTDANRTLDTLQLILIAVAIGGVVLAGALGRVIAQAGLGPIHRLRRAIDHVTETGDMSSRVPDQGTDELGRLGAHFNRMLAALDQSMRALDQSMRAQRQLVADASHELRTPLSSLRTNIEVLQRSPAMPIAERDRLLADVVAQTAELSKLIGDLIDLARDDESPEAADDVRLDWLVAAAAERAGLMWPQVRFEAELHDSTVIGQANRLQRAIANLLDNAGKWSPSGGVVEVCVTDHELTVRDHGPGIAPDDLPYVFDRFWRASGARDLPGSGLGLSIVRQVAEAHGARITAELPEGGGTLMRLRFPTEH
jgi:two-component system sensor histidine kinase MprB